MQFRHIEQEARTANRRLAKVEVHCSGDTVVVNHVLFFASTFVVKIATFARRQDSRAYFKNTNMIRSLFFSILSFSLFLSCKIENNDQDMKNDVTNYFMTIKKDSIEETKKLFSENGQDNSGIIPADVFFIKSNYKRINPDSLVKNMKIKDSYIISPNIKSKQIEFVLNAENDSLNIVKPLIITFEFPVPYKKNSMTLSIQNMFEWRDNKSDLIKYKK